MKSCSISRFRSRPIAARSPRSSSMILRALRAVRRFLADSATSALFERERFKMEFLRYWSDEMEKPRNADAKRLLRYGFKVYSQNDEDGIIQEIFRRIGSSNRTFVEFGAGDGLEC